MKKSDIREYLLLGGYIICEFYEQKEVEKIHFSETLGEYCHIIKKGKDLHIVAYGFIDFSDILDSIFIANNIKWCNMDIIRDNNIQI